MLMIGKKISPKLRTSSVPINRISYSSSPVLTVYWTTETVCSSASGVDSHYVLLNIPNDSNNTLLVYVNGILQRNNIDYTISGINLIFNSVVEQGRNIIVFYSYNA